MNIHGIISVALIAANEIRYDPDETFKFVIHKDGLPWLPMSGELLKDMCHSDLTAWVDDCLEKNEPSAFRLGAAA